MAIIKDEMFDVMHRAKSVRQEQNAKTRLLGEPALVPLAQDGPRAMALIKEIQTFIAACAVDDAATKTKRQGGYSDLVGKWRVELRAARYLDWQAQRGGSDDNAGGRAQAAGTGTSSPAGSGSR